VSVSVLLVDDQELIRSAIAALVDAEPDLTVVGHAADGRTAVDAAASTQPDVVLMDVRMPVLDGVAATREITTNAATTRSRVIILTTFDLDEYVFGAIRAGASGFLLKNTPAADLLAAIRIVAAGQALLTPSATRRLIAAYATRPRPGRAATTDLGALTDRETDILRLIAMGLSNEEICAHHHISMGTTKTHIGHLRTKLGARDRAQLVIAAYEARLV
jgi:DNA-binding NarL/FixJ family response regulator